MKLVLVEAEYGVSVLKILGFKTFPFFRWFRIRYQKKYRVLYKWYKKVIGNGFWIRFRSTFGYFGWRFCFEISGFRNFSFFPDGIGFGLEKS